MRAKRDWLYSFKLKKSEISKRCQKFENNRNFEIFWRFAIYFEISNLILNFEKVRNFEITLKLWDYAKFPWYSAFFRNFTILNFWNSVEIQEKTLIFRNSFKIYNFFRNRFKISKNLFFLEFSNSFSNSGFDLNSEIVSEFRSYLENLRKTLFSEKNYKKNTEFLSEVRLLNFSKTTIWHKPWMDPPFPDHRQRWSTQSTFIVYGVSKWSA